MSAGKPRLITRAGALVLAASIALTGTAYAEDGTSGITPDPVANCEIVESTWHAVSSATPVASPVVETAATPVASSATPVADENALLKADLENSIGGILNCMSSNDAENLAKITSPEFRGQWLGVGDTVSDADLAALLPMMPRLSYQLISLESATAQDGTATASITFTVGRQKISADWTLKQEQVDGRTVWSVQRESLKPTVADEGAAQMKVTIDDGSFTFDPATVAEGEIVINVSNTGSNPHEILVMRVPAGMTAADIAAAPTGIPDGATFVAQATVPAGESGTIVLTNVRAGSYTVVDLLPDANGMPNISNGMIGTFEVTKP